MSLEEELSEPDSFTIQPELTSIILQLDEEQGYIIKSLVEENYTNSMTFYCRKVGIPPPNFYNVVNGKKPCSLEQLNKLLSGIGYIATISNPEILIQEVTIGEIVNDVDSVIPDDESLLKDSEEVELSD